MATAFKRPAVILSMLVFAAFTLFSCNGGDAAASSSSSSDTSGDSSASSSPPSSSVQASSGGNSASGKDASLETSSAAASKSSAAPKASSSYDASSKPSGGTSSNASSSKPSSSKAQNSSKSGGATDYGPRISDDPSQSSDTGFYADVEDELVELLNGLREEQGLSPLKKSSSLASGARVRAKEMFDYNYFAHSRPDGGSWDSVFKVEVPLSGYSYLGENLAQTTGMLPNAAYIMDLWTNSPGHYENMVREVYTHVGIGVFYGYIEGKGKYTYAVQEFGTF